MTIPVLLAAGASLVGGVVHGQDVDERKLENFSTDSLMDLLMADSKVMNAKRFDTNPPFFWRSEISSDRIDSYFTRMHESTLMAFADTATEGVAFQYSHDWKKLGLGRSLKGTFERIKKTADKTGETAAIRTVVDFYTVPGVRMNSDMGTDDFILAVETGLLFDVSVGFYAGAVKCGICGGDMYNGWFGIFGKDCNHFPGEEYPTLDKNGNETGEKQLCFAWIYDGRLSEVSQVYDGATPHAGHLKAEMWAEEGRLQPRHIRSLEDLYERKLPGGRSIVLVGASTEEKDMALKVAGKTRAKRDDDPEPKVEDVSTVEDVSDDDPTTNPDPESTTDENTQGDPPNTEDDTEDERSMLADLQRSYGERGITLGATARDSITFLADLVLIKELEGEAKAGRQYRTTLLANAKKDAAAALGDNYDDTIYDGIFRSLDIEHLEKMAGDFKAQADAKFPSGRQTGESPTNIRDIRTKDGDAKLGKVVEPDAAYR
jgi:hypothetical protein